MCIYLHITIIDLYKNLPDNYGVDQEEQGLSKIRPAKY